MSSECHESRAVATQLIYALPDRPQHKAKPRAKLEVRLLPVVAAELVGVEAQTQKPWPRSVPCSKQPPPRSDPGYPNLPGEIRLLNSLV